MPNLGQNLWFFLSHVTLKFKMILKINRAPPLCYFKLCASFHWHWSILTGIHSRNTAIGTKFLTCDPNLWPWPFTWTSDLSIVGTPENFMMRGTLWIYLDLWGHDWKKWVWPTFGCKLGQNYPLVMQLKLDMSCHLLNVYTKFQIDISKHVEEKPGKRGRTDGLTLPRHNTSRFSNGRITTLVQVMACHLLAACHYLNQCWLNEDALEKVVCKMLVIEVLILKRLGHFFQNVILFSNVVQHQCNIFIWNWSNTMNV